MMSLTDIAKTLREAWDILFVSRHTLFLEAENSRLRAQVGHLEMVLSEGNKPIQAPAANKEDWKKVPQRVGGDSFWNADMARARRSEIFKDEVGEPEVQETV